MTDLAWTGWDWPHCGGGPNSRSLLVRRASERESARSSESCPHQSLARIVFLASADTPTRAFLQPLVSLMSAHPVRTFGEGSGSGAGAMLVAYRLAGLSALGARYADENAEAQSGAEEHRSDAAIITRGKQ